MPHSFIHSGNQQKPSDSSPGDVSTAIDARSEGCGPLTQVSSTVRPFLGQLLPQVEQGSYVHEQCFSTTMTTRKGPLLHGANGYLELSAA